MKQILSFLFALAAFSSFANGDKPEYAVKNIPQELMANADVVIRRDETVYDIKNPSEIYHKTLNVITFFSDMKELRAFMTSYSKVTSVLYFKVNIYDGDGKLIKSVPKEELIDQSYVSAMSIMEDNRILGTRVSYDKYPFTVEVEYKTKSKGTLGHPGWHVIPDYKISVEQSSYELLVSNDCKFRYKLKNSDIQPVVKEEKEAKSYLWKATNIKALKEESMAPDAHELGPILLIATDELEYDGYKAKLATWKDFGDYYYNLNKGRDELPVAMKTKVDELIKGVDDPKEKVRVLYNWMQENMRYVSIQLGIGGHQSFDATYVYENKYGDCKALSNFMQAMCHHAGLPANSVLIKAGEGAKDFEPDFVASQFNHCILQVPLPKDTIWLECTSNSNASGFLGSFTEGRHCLVATPQGGFLTKTPTFTEKDNTRYSKTACKIDRDGKMNVLSNSLLGGTNVDLALQLKDATPEQKEGYLRYSTELNDFELVKWEVENNKATATATSTMELNVAKYGQTAGDRLIIKPVILGRVNKVAPKMDGRTTPFKLEDDFSRIDTIEFALPYSSTLESLPYPTYELKSKFGEYSITSDVSQPEKLVIIRKIKMIEGQFPGNEFNDYVDFMTQIKKVDNMKVGILLRKP